MLQFADKAKTGPGRSPGPVFQDVLSSVCRIFCSLRFRNEIALFDGLRVLRLDNVKIVFTQYSNVQKGLKFVQYMFGFPVNPGNQKQSVIDDPAVDLFENN